MKCHLHHLVRGDQHLVVDGTRDDARLVARERLGVGAVVLLAVSLIAIIL